MKTMTTVLIVIAALVLAYSGRIVYQNSQVPTLGVVDGKLKPVSSKPNNVSSQAEDKDKQVETWAFKTSRVTTMQAIKKSVEEYGGAKIIEETDDYLYVIFTTSLMKYNDDVEFWLDTQDQVVHFRSASRAGYSDLGLNRQRYNELASLYSAK